MTAPSKYDDVIDVRDVIARIEHLEALRQPGPIDLGPEDNDQAQDDLFAELASLEAFLSQMKGNGGDEQWRGDWYPITAVRDSHFEQYAEDLAEELDLIPANAAWPTRCIDWAQAARELKQDYMTVEFDDITYWVR